MTMFNDREKAFENQYAHDQELQFKVMARRNKLAGLWAAEKMGLASAEAESYAKEVVAADFEEAGDEDVIRKLLHDLKIKGTGIGEDEIRKELARLLDVAKQQIMTG